MIAHRGRSAAPFPKIIPAPELLISVKKCVTPKVPLWMHSGAATERFDGLGIVELFDGDNEPSARRRFHRACVDDVSGALKITWPDPVPSRVPELVNQSS
jgi:hypothetical protein